MFCGIFRSLHDVKCMRLLKIKCRSRPEFQLKWAQVCPEGSYSNKYSGRWGIWECVQAPLQRTIGAVMTTYNLSLISLSMNTSHYFDVYHFGSPCFPRYSFTITTLLPCEFSASIVFLPNTMHQPSCLLTLMFFQSWLKTFAWARSSCIAVVTAV